MKKLLLIAATLVACTCFVACKESDSEKMERIKTECIGSWEGQLAENTITVTFTENTISTSEGFSSPITEWNYYKGIVFFLFKDSQGYSDDLIINIDGNNMTLEGDTQFVESTFPTNLTKVE